MRFYISSVYSELGYFFEIENNITLDVIKNINQMLKDDCNFNLGIDKENYDLGIFIDTKPNLLNVILSKPMISRKYKSVDYKVLIPYEIVVNSDNVNKTFLEFLFTGIQRIFDIYTGHYNSNIIKIKEKIISKWAS
ncbi:MAG: hypothetical protein R2794_07880 [Chitinophagales bacterium]